MMGETLMLASHLMTIQDWLVAYSWILFLARAQTGYIYQCEEKLKRRLLLSVLFSSGLVPSFSSSAKTKSKNPYDERRLLEQNRRIQRENNAPEDFPNFVREGEFLLYKRSHSFLMMEVYPF